MRGKKNEVFFKALQIRNSSSDESAQIKGERLLHQQFCDKLTGKQRSRKDKQTCRCRERERRKQERRYGWQRGTIIDSIKKEKKKKVIDI